MNNLYVSLYTSLLAPDINPSGITDIVRRSRVNNRLSDITGMLVFDGMAFCGYLEGEPSGITGVMKKIVSDPRNTDVRILYEGITTLPRRFAEWSMAYCSLDHESLTDLFSGVTAQAAMQRFETLMPLVDAEPRA